GQGGVRERAAALLAGSGVGAKVAIGALTVAVIAGGSIGATHIFEHPGTSHLRLAPPSVPAVSAAAMAPVDLLGSGLAAPARVRTRRGPQISRRPRGLAPGHVVASAPRPSRRSALPRYEPGGFAYLGVPASASPPASNPEPVHSAGGGGGAFSP
ncbi:MAG: hypothetical protein ACYDA6_01690, partial [Solirubrobacteraceae bacterium]